MLACWRSRRAVAWRQLPAFHAVGDSPLLVHFALMDVLRKRQRRTQSNQGGCTQNKFADLHFFLRIVVLISSVGPRLRGGGPTLRQTPQRAKSCAGRFFPLARMAHRKVGSSRRTAPGTRVPR